MISFTKVGSHVKFSDGSGIDKIVGCGDVQANYHSSSNTVDVNISTRYESIIFPNVALANISIAGATPVSQSDFEAKWATVFLSPGGSGSSTQATDFEVTDTTKGYILKSPDGTRWRLTIGNDGALIATNL